MAYIIAEPCVDVMDKSCVDVCPVDCIYEGDRKLYIHPGECIDCSACQPVCPVDAVFFEEELPQRWSHYVSANTDFFDAIGSPGGALPTRALVPVRREDPPIWRSLARVLARRGRF